MPMLSVNQKSFIEIQFPASLSVSYTAAYNTLYIVYLDVNILLILFKYNINYNNSVKLILLSILGQDTCRITGKLI